ncbi:MAG: SAM-dependent methyltransferase [Planctomycetaceae bacterium]
MTSSSEQLQDLLSTAVRCQTLVKAVFSSPAVRGDHEPSRIDVRPVLIRNQPSVQLAVRQGQQEFHQNYSIADAETELGGLCDGRFRDVRLETVTEIWTASCDRVGRFRVKQLGSRPTATDSQPVDHNRTRQYLIPDGMPCPFLIATGIMSADGKVRASHYRKFRQINRYLEFIRDIHARLPAEGIIRVIDFGCGKSYLTFAAHHLLTEILHRDVHMTGLDRRPDVISTCQKIVEELQLSSLNFEQGDIAGYAPEGPVHLAISLHACDTATDDALANAVAWGSDVIFAVPCCQHELATALPADRFPALSRHGILHERFASLATDSIRSALLAQVGYETDVMEFIDMEHTAKNILIRAVRKANRGAVVPNSQTDRGFQAFLQQLGVGPLRLQRKLEEFGLLPTE